MNVIAIYRSGLLGDTLVVIPILNFLRSKYPKSKIIYIWQNTLDKKHVSPVDILFGTELVDEFVCDNLYKNPIVRFMSLFKLFVLLKSKKISCAIVLEASYWSSRRKQFFKLLGISSVLGPEGNKLRKVTDQNGNIISTMHITDELFELLKPLNIQLPAENKGNVFFPVLNPDVLKINSWLNNRTIRNGYIAVSLWSNMPLKRWPIEKYTSLLIKLIDEFNIVPIFFGGKEDRSVAEKVVKELNTGYIVAGELTVSEGICLMSRCLMYIGNDTGTMHMAVCSGISCVSIFSSMDVPGRWFPYGLNHKVFRTKVDCECCYLRECIDEDMKCIKSITVEDVYSASKIKLLEKINNL